MAVRRILLFPDAGLSQPSAVVKDFGHPLQGIVRDLVDTLEASPGVGLAAPQIGIAKRVCVIDVSRSARKGKVAMSHHGRLILVNPVSISSHGTQIPREGCLSVPDLLANVSRFERITAEYFDEKGGKHQIESSGFEALALQHEIDHLNGVLFLDRVANLKTDLFRRRGN